MSNIIAYKTIENKLILIGKTLILLDKDVAELYGIKPIKLREQVKRNIQKFPKEYAYQISDEELSLMVSQKAIPSKQQLGGHNPWVFTEKGLYMVATILKSPMAMEATFSIIETFSKVRQLSKNLSIIDKVENEEKQNELVLQSNELLEAIIDISPEVVEDDEEIIETETRFELNLGIVKISRSTKKKKNE